jgi:hypothetical protein
LNGDCSAQDRRQGLKLVSVEPSSHAESEYFFKSSLMSVNRTADQNVRALKKIIVLK